MMTAVTTVLAILVVARILGACLDALLASN